VIDFLIVGWLPPRNDLIVILDPHRVLMSLEHCICENEIMSSFRSGEQPKNKRGYWINELESLGISPKEIIDENNYNKDELSSIEELANLVDNIKQTMYQEYKTVYSERMMQLEAEEEHAIVV
jgi:hypothetical protein